MPERVRIFGRGHLEPSTQVDEPFVAAHAAQVVPVIAVRPQLVVARHPQHAGEPVAEQHQRPVDVRQAFGDVAGHDQPVVRVGRPDALEDLAVVTVADVQVTHGVEPGDIGARSFGQVHGPS